MHEETIDAKAQSVLGKIGGKEFLKPFYLAGGTALAIQLGHRISVDFDFFTPTHFSTSLIKEELSHIGTLLISSEDPEGTLNGSLDGVSISFFIYPYENKYPLIQFHGVFLADERDIAAMKIDAISTRGSRKDFTDLYFLLRKYRLGEIINFFETRYSRVKYNKLHILKSLMYFEDADNDPPPILIQNVSWNEIKRTITSESKKLVA
ncbi:nucleotidyl transferase AbiEii/AbiGii toxin family protein [bacterium]|nr:nucleotidyl transferase AbiEii/AbiGii toxin family protein [bacterium]